MATNERDQSHFEAIGRAMATAKVADRAAVATSAPAERVRIGFLLGDVPRSAAVEAAITADALGQIGLARKRPVRTR
jgi:hypothetical protein